VTEAWQVEQSLVLLDKVVVRLRPLAVFAATCAIVVAQHLNLLPFSQSVKNVVELICLVVIALNNPPISRYVEPRTDVDLRK